MAKSFLPLGIITLSLSLLTGCAQTEQAPLAFPSPNLEAPLMVSPLKVSPVVDKSKTAAPVVDKSKTEKVAQPVKANPNVPSTWVPIVQANTWRWIVIHHSASANGCAATFDRAHRENGWDELGYHFVIGNGTGSRDGEIEVGTRWPVQKWGAHAKTPDNRYNDFGIGICLVGNFENSAPTAKQLESLTKLTSYLMETYHVSPDNVLGHGQTKSTDCPGKYMPMAWIRQESTLKMAEWRSPQMPTNPPIAQAGDKLVIPISR